MKKVGNMMSIRSLLTRLLGILGVVALAIVIYSSFIRPWHVRWGATDEEVARRMAGDDAVDSPDSVFTRAITINAAQEDIWQWILQLGDQRAGFYAYDWFDNRGERSSEEILPEFQQVEEGDPIPISSSVIYVVYSIDDNKSIVWVSDDDPTSGSWTWSLYPADDGQTRLVTRLQASKAVDFQSQIFKWVVDGGDIVFMRKSMLGIKQRAEGNITDSYAEDTLEGLLWGSSLLQFLAAIVLILTQKRWLKFLLLSLAIAGIFQLTFFARPPIIVGILLQIATLLTLIWISGSGGKKSVYEIPLES